MKPRATQLLPNPTPNAWHANCCYLVGPKGLVKVTGNVQLKIEYTQPFLDSALVTLQCLSGSPATLGPLSLMGASFTGASVNVATRVRGSLEGDVICSMSYPTAQFLAEMTTGSAIHGFGEPLRRGLVGLAKMWGDQARLLLAEMGHECEVADPIVFQGLNVEMAMTQTALTAPIETLVGQVNVSVAVRNGG
jgi:chemotaxis protein CheX